MFGTLVVPDWDSACLFTVVEGNQTLASALSSAGFETLTRDYLLNEKFNTNYIRRALGHF